MEPQGSHPQGPAHAIPRKYLEPILYLAEELRRRDPLKPVPAKLAIDELAEVLGVSRFREQRWFRELSETRACALLDQAVAKDAALVTLTYVMKTDTNRGDGVRERFTKIRQRLEAEPVKVPSERDAHRALVLRYLRD